ncbi:MAG: integrase core domain-containing protein [Atopobiaceae bacterium]|nr:integrase core domain-containing protein [Atopobiaceae bacterium]
MPISALVAERRFRDLKHNRVYQTEHSNMRELRRVIAGYVERYNFRRLHSSLDYSTPAEWYFSGMNEANAPAEKMGKWAA